MVQSNKLAAGAAFPNLTWPTVGGDKLDIAAMPGWRLLAVYRGKHCPLCKRYFKTLDGLLDDFKAAGVAVAAVSADPREKAEADVGAADVGRDNLHGRHALRPSLFVSGAAPEGRWNRGDVPSRAVPAARWS